MDDKEIKTNHQLDDSILDQIEQILPKMVRTLQTEDTEIISAATNEMRGLRTIVSGSRELNVLLALAEIHQVSEEYPEEEPLMTDWDETEWREEFVKYEALFIKIEQGEPVDDFSDELAYLAHNPEHCRVLIDLIAKTVWQESEEGQARLEQILFEYADFQTEKPSIALCYFAHGHPEAIEEVLEKNVAYFEKYGIDVFYLDDLMDEPTKAVIEKYQNRYQNIYHICTIGKPKWYFILNNLFSEKQYDYVWPSKDRGYFTEKIFQDVRIQVKKRRDAILLGQLTFSPRRYSCLYHDPVELYGNFAPQTTSINSSVFRASSLFPPYQKEVLLHMIEEGMDMIAFLPFWIVFNTLGQRGCCSVKVIRRPDATAVVSDKAVSGWKDKMLELWAGKWVGMNDALPDCYGKYKARVIKEVSTLPWLLGGEEQLAELKRRGILTQEKLNAVRENWGRVSDVPIEEVEEIIREGH